MMTSRKVAAAVLCLALLPVFVLAAVAGLGCYDAKQLPPCPEGARWPDPCAGQAADAGSESAP